MLPFEVLSAGLLCLELGLQGVDVLVVYLDLFLKRRVVGFGLFELRMSNIKFGAKLSQSLIKLLDEILVLEQTGAMFAVAVPQTVELEGVQVFEFKFIRLAHLYK